MTNEAHGTVDHERIQTKSNKAYEGTLITKQNEPQGRSRKKLSDEEKSSYNIIIPTNLEDRTHSTHALHMATVVPQSYEQTSI